MFARHRAVSFVGLSLVCLAARWAGAEEVVAKDAQAAPESKVQIARAADGALLLSLPAEWEAAKPRNRIIELEYVVPAPVDDDGKPLADPGRLTVMAAGGGVEANIARWLSQFQTAEGKPLSKDDVKVQRLKVGDLEIVQIDLAGTFLDKPRGPFGPTEAKPEFRLLALIVPTPKHGSYFVKLTAPAATAKAAEKGFHAMAKGVKYDANAKPAPK